MQHFCGNQNMQPILHKFVADKLTTTRDYSFPFAKAACSMICFLCDMLNIGRNGK
jgi:hypothetical protein